jgi:hypothetical protein
MKLVAGPPPTAGQLLRPGGTRSMSSRNFASIQGSFCAFHLRQAFGATGFHGLPDVASRSLKTTGRSLAIPSAPQLFGLAAGDGKPALTSWRTIRTSMMFGVTGGIFSPVSKA